MERSKASKGLFFYIRVKILEEYFIIIGDVYMKSAVLYFSRSGNSKRIAEKVALGLNISPIEITDDKDWRGVLGYIKAGYYSALNKSVAIKVNETLQGIDQYIVISPVWAGGPAPAVREFLKSLESNKVYLVMTSVSSDFRNSLEKYENKVGKLKGYFGIIKKQNNEDKIIEEIIQKAK
jgi:flavodoxin